MQTAEELNELRINQPPPAEIKFVMKNGDKVTVRTNKLSGSPNYTYTGMVDATGAIIWHTMSRPSQADIVAAYISHQTSRKP